MADLTQINFTINKTEEKNMKKIIALLVLASVSCFGAEANLIPAPFRAWYNPATAQVTFADGIYTITANTNPKFNGYQKAQVNIPLKGSAMQNKKMTLSFKYRTARLNGALQVAVREAFGKNYSTYHGARLRRWDASPEWKEYKHTFTTRKDTTLLSFYIVGYYMKAGEKVELKDLKVTQE